jgi:protein TonB
MVTCFLLAAGLHGGVLFGLGLSLTEPPAYGVRAGQNSLEVELVAAPSTPSVDPTPDIPATEIPVPEPEPQKQADPIEEEEPDDLTTLTILATTTRPDPAPARAPQTVLSAPKPQSTREKGDGSSPVPGRDATTLRSTGGARGANTASYLSNPEPPYPDEARRLGIEGVVTLLVRIDSRGRPVEVRVLRSSGSSLLDRHTADFVRKRWEFKPAKVGGIPVESEVEIPVRYSLYDRR